jgi:hypothetical protein
MWLARWILAPQLIAGSVLSVTMESRQARRDTFALREYLPGLNITSGIIGERGHRAGLRAWRLYSTSSGGASISPRGKGSFLPLDHVADFRHSYKGAENLRGLVGKSLGRTRFLREYRGQPFYPLGFGFPFLANLLQSLLVPLGFQSLVESHGGQVPQLVEFSILLRLSGVNRV